jgi:transposase-like protein
MRRERKMTQAILPSYRTFSESKGKQLQAKLKTCEKKLHAEGWSITSIAEYLATSRQTVYNDIETMGQRGSQGPG